MKNILLAFALLFGFTAFSQGLTLGKESKPPIKYESGKFYANGNQISSREARALFATNVKSATLFKQAKSKEGLGGFLLGFGIGLTVGDLAIGLFSDKKYPSALTYVGVGSMAVSIPVLSGRKRRIEEAVKSYNADRTEEKLGANKNTFELNAVTSQNGFGLQLKF